MTRLACPRCGNIIDADESAPPPCPKCGFVGAGAAAQTAAATQPAERADAYGQSPAPWPPAYPAHPGHSSPVQPYGGFWIRVVAYLLDALILFLPLLLLTTLLLGGPIDPFAEDDPFSPRQGIEDLIGTLAGWLYFALFESSRHQATPGKMAVGLKVTTLAGHRISFARATGRYFAHILSALILLVGFFMIGWTERKQGLHDKIAGTLVYKKSHAPQVAPEQRRRP